MTEKRKILRWRRSPKETGLRAIAFDNDKRGWELHYGDEHVGSANYSAAGQGFFWVACGKGMPYKNTWLTPSPTVEETKIELEAYVRRHLGLPSKKTKPVTKKK